MKQKKRGGAVDDAKIGVEKILRRKERERKEGIHRCRG